MGVGHFQFKSISNSTLSFCIFRYFLAIPRCLGITSGITRRSPCLFKAQIPPSFLPLHFVLEVCRKHLEVQGATQGSVLCGHSWLIWGIMICWGANPGVLYAEHVLQAFELSPQCPFPYIFLALGHTYIPPSELGSEYRPGITCVAATYSLPSPSTSST